MTAAPSPSRRRLLAAAIETVVAASAAPYGYTVSLWSTGAILMHTHGTPDVPDVVLFAIGAVGGFAVLGLAAIASTPPPETLDGGGERIVAGMLNWLAVGAALGSAALLAEIPGRLAWMLASAAATSLYLLGASAQLALVDRRLRRRGGG